MNKNKLFIILFLLCLPTFIYADYDAIINDSSVRIRTEASTESDPITTVNKGTSIIVPDKTLYEGKGCDSKWVKVIYKEKNGYVCSKYVTYVNNSFNGMNVSDWTARVTGNNVAVRKTASEKGTLIERLSLGVNVNILDEKDGWYKISYYNGSVGWMSKTYVKKKEEITANDEEY